MAEPLTAPTDRPPTTPPPAPRSTKPLPTLVAELWDLTKAYLRQETIQPIKGLGRYVAFGVAGSVSLSIGLVLLVLAALRAMQEELGDTFDDDWTWVPYLITLFGCVVVVALCARGIQKGRGARRGKV